MKLSYFVAVTRDVQNVDVDRSARII